MRLRRLVLDATVPIAALLRPQGASAQLLRSCARSDAFEWVLTAEIQSELERALADDLLRDAVLMSHQMIERFSSAIALLATLVEVDSEQRLHEDIYVAAALEVGDAVLVSLDLELRALAAAAGVETVSPQTAVDLIAVDAGETILDAARS